ncbi:MAG: PrgI family protein [Candidatus Paceibacterota bacterium]|jgi:hypothetical protein
MQFQVPQFIEVEDKIFGPLTLKEFLYLGGGVGLSVVLILFIPFKIISIPLALLFMSFSLALAFYKVNGKPFANTLEAAFYYWGGNKLYIWKKTEKKPTSKPEEIVQQAKAMISVPKLSESKLKDLTWSLDIKESLNPGTREMKR